MGNSFGYFADDNNDKKVLNEINRILAPGGRLVLDLTDGGYMRDNFAERSWEWVDDKTFVCRERQLSKDNLRLVSREIITVTGKGVIRDQFYQERLYNREELNQLIMQAGLEATIDETPANSPDSIITIGKELSKRKEDLGMMEQRMLVMAKKTDHSDIASSEISSSENTEVTVVDSLSNEVVADIPRKKPALRNVAVIMGDPSLPCFGKLNSAWNPEDIVTRQKLLTALEEIGYNSDSLTVFENHQSLHRILAAKKPDFVLNLCDEGFRNDALKELHVPALLELLDIPYSGAGPNCLAYCYDKGLVNRTAQALGIATPNEIEYHKGGLPNIPDLDALADHVQAKISYPAFIKPVKGDNSLGITVNSIVHNSHDLKSYMAELESMGIYDVLVQEYLQGTEYGVGVLGNLETGFHFFPILEVDYANIISQDLPPILGYESKWDPKSPYWTDIKYKKASLSPEIESLLKQYCTLLWERFGCRDYARFDFRCDQGRGDGYDEKNGLIKLLEVNPNPGWCWDGKLAYMGAMEGLSYAQVLEKILEAAATRVLQSQ
jgi:D-alanine-D-alanine ligase